MKGPQVAVLVWLGNLLLFGGGGWLGYQVYTEIKDDRDSVDAVTRDPKAKLKRVDWLAASTAKEAAQHQDFSNDKLSLRVRPKPPEVKPDVKPVDPKPEPEPDDAALKAELQKWLDGKFAVIRVLAGPPSFASASVIAKDVRNTVFKVYTDTHFSDLFAKNADDELAKKLREMDVRSVAIKPGGVVFKAPSVNPKYKAKYFEVELPVATDPNYKVAEPGGTLGKPGASTAVAKPPDRLPMPPGRLPDPAKPPPDTRPAESTYDEKTDTWTIGTNDFEDINKNFDQLATHAKVVYDKSGKPLGIQITEEIPENSVVVARGGKKGDIIKAINGKPVASMGDVRAIVTKERNAGVEKFVVDFERGGVPQQKTFNVPKKK